ncbi:MAG: hypothetical protein QOI86_4419 [Actinomycetota bacterium]|jgi:hypothetical protein|nr:hypothetical protein [Actinomycetota bacterium]
MRKLRRMGVGGGAALLAAALIAPAGVAHADTTTVTDQYGASASSQVVDLDLLGRHVSFGAADVNSTLDAVTKQVNAEAKGLGTLLVPASQAIARFNDPASVNKACALPQVDQVTGLLSGTTQGLNLPVVGNLLGGGALSLGGLLPKLDINVGCAEANVGGNADSFLAESVGGILQIHVALPQIVSGLAGTLRDTVKGLGVDGLPVVGGLLGGQSSSAITSATSSINNLLGGVLGNVNLPVVGNVTQVLNLNTIAPALAPATTVDGLLKSLQDGDLIRVDLGVATARNAGDLQSYLSQAVAEGGSIDILPNLLGSGKSLLKIDVMKSDAKVSIDRNTMQAVPAATNTLVRVESALLPDLGLSSLPIVGGLLGSSGLPVVGSVVPVVNGLLGGIPAAIPGQVTGLLGFDATVKGLGLNAGDGYIELGPGMSVSVLCDGLVAPLCTEISVGAASAPTTTADGRTRIESSAVTIHLLKGLNTLTAGLPIVGGLGNGLNLGTILGNGSPIGGLVSGLVGGTTGLSLGEPTDVPGIRISLAHAVAEAGGTKVMGANEEKARQLDPVAAAPIAAPALPRTGGLPVDATAIPVLLGASAGLRTLVRRRRRNA